MSELEESCREVLLAWTPSIVFLFIVLLRDWLVSAPGNRRLTTERWLDERRPP
jgi:hypothetical protein